MFILELQSQTQCKLFSSPLYRLELGLKRVVNTPPLFPAVVGLLRHSCSSMPGRIAGERKDCAHVTGHTLVMGSVLAQVWMLGSVPCWWPPLCGDVCVTACFHMAGDSYCSENASHAFSMSFLGWDLLLLCPGLLPLITVGSFPYPLRATEDGVKVSWAHHI